VTRAVLAALALAALAATGEAAAQTQTQTQDAHAGHDMSGMAGMAGMKPTEPTEPAEPTEPMQGMGMQTMQMAPMQGGSAPANARSGDWSDGIPASSMQGMAMHDMDDTASVRNLLLDRVESFAGQGSHGQSWELNGWYGNDTNKLWLRSEGDRTDRKTSGDVELFWSHAVAAFWDTQLGVRQDIGQGPDREWAAFGVQGLAPYRFDVEATAYAGAAGRTAARLRIEYELLVSQRLILQPELEVNAYGKDDHARGIGKGVSNVEGGLRLRYEFTRAFAPYVGISWEHLAGGTADLAEANGRRVTDRRWVAGVRLWF